MSLMAVVHAAQRNAMPTSNFAVPGKRKLLIHDATHAKLAWDMVSRTHGLSSSERASARRRIKAKLHSLGIDTSSYNDEKNASSFNDGTYDTGDYPHRGENNSTHDQGEIGTRSVYGYPSKTDPTSPKPANMSPWTDAVEKMSIGEQEALCAFIPDLAPQDGYALSTAIAAIVGAQVYSNQAAMRAKGAPDKILCYFSGAAQAVKPEAGSKRQVKIPVARIGTFVHQRYGMVDFKQSDFDDMVRNFEDKEDGFPQGPYLRYGHEKFPGAVDGEAAIAYLKKLVQEDDVLFGIYDPLDDNLAQDIDSGTYSGASAELTRHAISKHDGRPIGTLLTAHALTNAPFIPDLPRNQALSDSAAGTPSGGFMKLNLSHHEGATSMNPNEFLSMVDAQLEIFSVSADSRDQLKGYLSGALKEAVIPGTTDKTAGQPSETYNGGKENPKHNASGMVPLAADPSGLTNNTEHGEPSKVYGTTEKNTAGGSVADQGGTVEMNAHGKSLHDAAKDLDKMGDAEDDEKMSMFGELLSMFGKMMKGKAKKAPPFGKDGKPEDNDEKHTQAAQNLSGTPGTVEDKKGGVPATQSYSNNPARSEGEIDMKPTEVQAMIAEAIKGAVGATEQKFSTQLAEVVAENAVLKGQLQTTVAVAQAFTQNADKQRVQQRAEGLVNAGIAPTMVNAVLALASNPAFAGQQIKLSEGAAPTNTVDALLDILEQTPAEHRINFSQVGANQNLSDTGPDPYAEIISRVTTAGSK